MSKGRKVPDPAPPTPRAVAADLRRVAETLHELDMDAPAALLTQGATIIEHLAAQLAPKTDARGMVQFTVTSGVGADTAQPFVQVNYAGQVAQMSPEAARALALNIIGAAEAAESDWSVWRLVQEMGGTPEDAARWLVRLRAAREKRHGKEATSA